MHRNLMEISFFEKIDKFGSDFDEIGDAGDI
jgi:hypothetical protein